MREKNAPPARARDVCEEFANGFVGKVSVPSADALLGGPRAFGISLEELGAVVGLDDDDIAIAYVFAYVLRNVTEVGEPSDRAAWRDEVAFVSGADAKAYGVVGVVRDGKRVDFEISEAKTGPSGKDLPIGPISEAQLKGACGCFVSEDFDVREFSQSIEGGRVIAVLMGEKDRLDVFEGFSEGGKELAEFAGGEAGVDEDARGVGGEQGAVARAAASENAETRGHSVFCGPWGECGQGVFLENRE